MTETSDEKRERLLQLQPLTLAVCELIKECRPDLYQDGDDATEIMDAVDRAWKPGITAEEVYDEVVPQLEEYKQAPCLGVDLTMANIRKIEALTKDIERVIDEKPVGHVLVALAMVVRDALRNFKGDEFWVMLWRFSGEVANFNFTSWRKNSPPSPSH